MNAVILRDNDTKLLKSQQKNGFDELGHCFQFYFPGYKRTRLNTAYLILQVSFVRLLYLPETCVGIDCA